ncbi:MAG: hypothetical protein ACOC55_01240 [Candidatus Natronoplasma sp.]
MFIGSIISERQKSKMLAIGLISLFLISVIFAGCIEEESQESPEGTFDLFVERINEKDGEGVIELLDTQFLDDDIWEDLPEDHEEFEEEMDAMEEAIDNGEMKIGSYEKEVNHLEDMDEDSSPINRTELEQFKEVVNENDNFTATVDDICVVEFEWNATVEEGSVLEFWAELDEMEEMDKPMLIMLEIEDEWYIAFSGLAGILYIEVGDEQEPRPIAGTITHHEGTEFEMTSLSTPSSANPDEVQITVFDVDDEGLAMGYIDPNNWSSLSDGEVVSGSRFDVNDISSTEITEEDIGKVVIKIYGYEGDISIDM